MTCMSVTFLSEYVSPDQQSIERERLWQSPESGCPPDAAKRKNLWDQLLQQPVQDASNLPKCVKSCEFGTLWHPAIADSQVGMLQKSWFKHYRCDFAHSKVKPSYTEPCWELRCVYLQDRANLVQGFILWWQKLFWLYFVQSELFQGVSPLWYLQAGAISACLLACQWMNNKRSRVSSRRAPCLIMLANFLFFGGNDHSIDISLLSAATEMQLPKCSSFSGFPFEALTCRPAPKARRMPLDFKSVTTFRAAVSASASSLPWSA